MLGANSRAQKSRTVSTSCSWSEVSPSSSTRVTKLLGRARCRAGPGRRRGLWRDLRRRGDLGCDLWCRRRASHGAWSHYRLEVFGADVPDERQMFAEAEDEWHDPRAMELRLKEVGVDLLELVNAGNRVEVGCGGFHGRR